MSDPTRRVPVKIGKDGVPYATTVTSPKDNKVRAQCVAPPHTVVPIIFSPGIMGTNLRDKNTKDSIWGASALVGLFFQWMFRSAKTRQNKLKADDAEVDPMGEFPGKSATVPDKEAGAKRGWGEVSKFSYGEFLRWLDDALNQDFIDADCDDKSPWEVFVGMGDVREAWGPEKPFSPIDASEAEHAWNFYCPVYAKGYNWIKSNGDSGKVLAEQIQTIIDEWNNFKASGHQPYQCEQVILVTHSMGGLVSRACVHEAFGAAADKVLGIVHGVMPATGSAATYHHCRSGYDFPSGIALGNNAAQVTAVVANSPGALELLPNQDYMPEWLQAIGLGGVAVLRLPAADPYDEIYAEKEKWWRLIDPKLIDPAGVHKKNGDGSWKQYATETLKNVAEFHGKLSTNYHLQTYAHYGADGGKKFRSYGYLRWESKRSIDLSDTEVHDAGIAKRSGSDPVVLDAQTKLKFRIADAADPGDGTVPAISGQGPHTCGGGNVKQSFRMKGFGHQSSYQDEQVKLSVLYCIGKLLQQAKEL